MNTYDVPGATLADVKDGIWGPVGSNGKRDSGSGSGPKEGGSGQNYAGEATYNWCPQGSGQSLGECTYKFTVTGTTCKFKIKLPKWTGYDSATQQEKDEWDRFIKALEEHERGHVKIYEKKWMEINAAIDLMEQAGTNMHTVTVNLTADEAKLPEEDKKKLKIKKAQMDFTNWIRDNVADSDGNNIFDEVQSETEAYDAPNSPSNPTGTDHGATQGATLNCP